jgi:hypothetical protein
MPITSTATVTLTLVVVGPLTVTTAALPQATVGQPYSFVMSASGGSGSYAWAATGLPPGLTISPSGLISGTPTPIGIFAAEFAVTFTVTDSGS